jgi:Reverse transcriptase (RNA-dependent DNA polymerase)
MSLTTGWRLAQNNWTPLPMPQDVIERVQDMATQEQRALAARQSTRPGIAFLDRNQRAFADDEAMLIAGVDGDDEQVAGVGNDEDYDYEQPGYGMDVNPCNKPDAAEAPEPDAAEAPEPDAAEAPEDAEAPHHHEHDAAEAPELDAVEAPHYDELDAAEHDEPDDVGVEAPYAQPIDDAEAPIPEVAQYEPDDIAQLELDAAMDAKYKVRTREGMRPQRRPTYGQLNTTRGAAPVGQAEGDMIGSRASTGNRGTIIVETVVEDSMDSDGRGDAKIEHAETPQSNDGGFYNGEADEAADAAEAAVLGFIFTQVSMKKVLKVYGDKGEAAVEEELQQLHDQKVMEPVAADSLTYAEKKKALEYLMFPKEKRTGKIKGRGCADGRKQRVTAKEEASSPTVSIESIVLTSVIDTLEGRHVADIPGAFLQADMDEVVHMRLAGKMVELLLRIAPGFEHYVVIEGDQRVLYVLLLKALYGTMRAALLFWRKLTSKLQGWGFETNPYDPCVANKTVNGSQCTVMWHVDNLKISHVDRKVVEAVLGLWGKEFGKEAPLTVCQEKAHDYLGIRIDYSVPGKVKFTMFDYLNGMLETLPKDMSGVAASPAANHLFEVDPKATAIDKDKAKLFHHYTAKLLFLCKRARPDIQTAVAFLTTRVKGPDIDYYNKLRWVMQYLRATKDMPLMLEADHMHELKWWVDASYEVHPDMKGHTGGLLSLGKGAVYGTSKGHKMVTRSSTEAELVSLYDVLPQILWTRNFLDAQGYGVLDSVVHQDNKSTILLAENGRMLSSKRTRHLNIRYFFVTDCVKAKELSIKYCPMEEMISDYFMKPLQGTLFRKMCDLIMNVDPAAANRWNHRSVLGDDVE